MERFPPSDEASKDFSEEAAIAASSAPHHDGAGFRGAVSRNEKAIIIPFCRAAPAGSVKLASPAISLGMPPGSDIPAYAEMMIAAVITRWAPEKNVALMPGEAEELIKEVLAALDLADLYRLAMAEPATVKKAGETVAGKLDEAAIRRIAVLVLYAEGKRDPGDPIVQRRVTAIVTETVKAAVAAGQPVIWPEPAETVANHYSKIPSAIVEELPHGTLTVHLLKGKLHRDPQEGPARAYRDDVRTWSEFHRLLPLLMQPHAPPSRHSRERN